jgi:hypothetical protein
MLTTSRLTNSDLKSYLINALVDKLRRYDRNITRWHGFGDANRGYTLTVYSDCGCDAMILHGWCAVGGDGGAVQTFQAHVDLDDYGAVHRIVGALFHGNSCADAHGIPAIGSPLDRATLYADPATLSDVYGEHYDPHLRYPLAALSTCFKPGSSVTAVKNLKDSRMLVYCHIVSTVILSIDTVFPPRVSADRLRTL